MKLLGCGGRGYVDSEAFKAAMLQLPFAPSLIIEGGAAGADRLFQNWAKLHGIPLATVPALWDFYGKRAGVRRNAAMLELLQPDYCVAMPGGVGTEDMVLKCVAAGVTVWRPYG